MVRAPGARSDLAWAVSVQILPSSDWSSDPRNEGGMHSSRGTWKRNESEIQDVMRVFSSLCRGGILSGRSRNDSGCFNPLPDDISSPESPLAAT
eukprot:1196234-Prorocentrum_minimum.AAC.3